MAKIIELYPGKDGKVRVVKLKTYTGEVIRPVRKIYPLEVQEKSPNQPLQCSSIEKTAYCEPDQKPEQHTVKVTESESVIKGVTRSGRAVRVPSRFND